MDTTDLEPLVEDLTSNIDDLEESLAPLIKTALSQSTGKLPLLDKAKLYVLATYALESILFSSLRLNGVDAKSHPVFQELARVKQYFAKIKTAETAGTKRTATLDKDAAGRFIKHGLAGNEKFDRERTERIAREKTGAKRKLGDLQGGTHTKFDEAQRMKEEGEPEPVLKKSKKKLSQKTSQVVSGDGDDVASGSPQEEEGVADKKSRKPPKSTAQALESLLEGSSSNAEGKKARKKDNKKKSKGEKAES